MILIGALLIAVIFGTFFICRPFAYAWDKTIDGGQCGDTTKYYLAIGIVNMIIDLSIVLLPMPILWKLQMPTNKKLAVSGILMLGLLYVSILRCIEIISDYFSSVYPSFLFSGFLPYLLSQSSTLRERYCWTSSGVLWRSSSASSPHAYRFCNRPFHTPLVGTRPYARCFGTPRSAAGRLSTAVHNRDPVEAENLIRSSPRTPKARITSHFNAYMRVQWN